MAIVALCLIAIGLLSEPDYRPAQNQNSATSDVKPTAPAARSEQDETKATDHAQAPKNSVGWWHAAIKDPNWWLVVVALGTGLAIAYQAREMRLATDVMRRQTKIQSAALMQWVDIETQGAGTDNAERFNINLCFQAVNNTNYPLTILRIETSVGYWANVWDECVAETNYTLAPSRNGKSAYNFYAIFKGTEKDINAFKKGTIFTINGKITYTDCLEETRIQEFGGLYSASPDRFDCLEPVGTVPDHVKSTGDPFRFDWWKAKRDKYQRKNPN